MTRLTPEALEEVRDRSAIDWRDEPIDVVRADRRALLAHVDTVEEEGKSWRRVAERCETEKQEALAERDSLKQRVAELEAKALEARADNELPPWHPDRF